MLEALADWFHNNPTRAVRRGLERPGSRSPQCLVELLQDWSCSVTAAQQSASGVWVVASPRVLDAFGILPPLLPGGVAMVVALPFARRPCSIEVRVAEDDSVPNRTAQ